MANIKISQGYAPGAIGWVAGIHGTYYSKNWNFGLFFEALAAVEVAGVLSNYDPAIDGFWLVWSEDKIIGSVTIVGPREPETSARLRWFILDPAFHGQGIGSTLLKTALDFCREKQYPRVYLTTFAGLDTARHVYEKAGFRLYHETEDTHWGSTLLEQTFELWLNPR